MGERMRQRMGDWRMMVCDAGARRSAAALPSPPKGRICSAPRCSRLGMAVVMALAVLLSGCLVQAQDKAETPLNLAGFDTHGSVTVGYRFTDIKGYRPMYQELSGLEKGFRLMDFNVFGEAAPGSHLFA